MFSNHRERPKGGGSKRLTALLLAVVIFLVGAVAPISSVPIPRLDTSRFLALEKQTQEAHEVHPLSVYHALPSLAHSNLRSAAHLFLPSTAEAAFPVFDLNKVWEHLKTMLQQWFNNLIQSFITSLTDINSLSDLLNLKNKLQNLVKNFNLGNLLNDIMNVALQEIGSMVMDSISSSISDALSGALSGSGLEELGITGDTIGKAISGALLSGNFKGAADGILTTLRGAAEKKIGSLLKEQFKKIDLKGKFGELSSAQPGGGGTGTGTPYDPPPSGAPSGGDPSTGGGGGGSGGGSGPDTSDAANPGMTKGEVTEASERAAGAANSALQDFAQTYPMTLPSAQSQTAVMSVQNLADSANRDLFAMQLSEQAKTPIISKVVSLTGKYKSQGEKQKSAFDEMLEKYEQANQDLAKQAGESFSGGGNGDALRYIAGMMGVQVQQTALMNSVLIAMNRVLADEITLLEQLAYLGVEPYAASVANQVSAYGTAYFRMTNVVQ